MKTELMARAADDVQVKDGQENVTQESGLTSRRDVLFGSALMAMFAAGCPTTAPPPPPGPPPPGPAPTPSPIPPPPPPPSSTLRRLIDRITFGVNKEEMALANSLGYNGYLEYHLNAGAIDNSEFTPWMAPYPFLNMTGPQFKEYESSSYWRRKKFIGATVVRSLYNKRQMLERMSEFWTDHFNIYIYKSWQDTLKMVDDRDVIRANALGNFPAMFRASAHSPAMLAYLDNDPSSNEAPNENYAREMMELHVLGVDQFTQEDVENVAKCLTGWSFDWSSSSPAYLNFVFREDKHDYGAKRVLGHDIPAGGGQSDGETLLDILTTDPNLVPITANFIGRKIASKFWGDNPPAALVSDVANAYIATGGDIKAMMRAVLAPQWLSSAPMKLKRPYHLAISSLRATDAWIDHDYAMYFLEKSLEHMGHSPYGWAPPNGYPDASGFWAGLLLPRWRFGADVVLKHEDIRLALDEYFQDPDPDALMNTIDSMVYGGLLTDSDRAAMHQYVSVNPLDLLRRLETLGLAFASPGFQWY
jgi:hypothetical protein